VLSLNALKYPCTQVVDEGEATCVCWDESRKKFIIGDSMGNVRVFNGLNGSFMAALAPAPTSDVSGLYASRVVSPRVVNILCVTLSSACSVCARM
jgi:hypothetical protein